MVSNSERVKKMIELCNRFSFHSKYVENVLAAQMDIFSTYTLKEIINFT